MVEIKVGKKVKVYNMYTKRYRTRYIVSINRKTRRVGLSTVKNGGVSGYVSFGALKNRSY